MALTQNVKFIALTETHLQPDILDSEIKIEGFTPYRSDRTERSHGGVILYIHNSLPCIILRSHTNYFCNVVISRISSLNLAIVVVYRPPNCPKQAFRDILDQIEDTIEHMGTPTPDIMLLGDLNFPHIKWPSGDILPGTTKDEREQAELLLKLTHTCFMSQYILKPTRNNNILDLAFTNNDNLVHHYEVTPTIFSDHNIIMMYLNYTSRNSPRARPSCAA